MDGTAWLNQDKFSFWALQILKTTSTLSINQMRASKELAYTKSTLMRILYDHTGFLFFLEFQTVPGNLTNPDLFRRCIFYF